MTSTTDAGLSMRNKAGFITAGLLGLIELLGPSVGPLAAVVLVSQYQERHDPENLSMDALGAVAIAVLVVTLALGLTTIVGIVLAWTRKSRIAARVVAGTRVVSAILIAPVFVLAGGLLPDGAWIIVIAAVVVIADIAAVILVLSRPART